MTTPSTQLARSSLHPHEPYRPSQGAAVLLLFPLLLLGDPAAARQHAEKPAGLDAAETAAAGAAEETGALTAPLLDQVHENGRI